MSHHTDRSEMEEAIERRENAKVIPDAYGIKEEPLEELREALAAYEELPDDAILWFRLAMNEDGTRTGYYEITVGEESVYCGNDVFPCPPFCCPPDCS